MQHDQWVTWLHSPQLQLINEFIWLDVRLSDHEALWHFAIDLDEDLIFSDGDGDDGNLRVREKVPRQQQVQQVRLADAWVADDQEAFSVVNRGRMQNFEVALPNRTVHLSHHPQLMHSQSTMAQWPDRMAPCRKQTASALEMVAPWESTPLGRTAQATEDSS